MKIDFAKQKMRGVCLLGLREDFSERCWIGLMFGGVDFLHEGFEGVGGVDRNGLLEDYFSGVDTGVDVVDGATGLGDAGFEGLAAGVESGKGGQEGGVNVDDAVGVGGEEVGFDDAHKAGEDDVVCLMLSKPVEDGGFGCVA